MDQDKIIQALNEMSLKIGDIADSTWQGLTSISGTFNERLRELNNTLFITNILLGLLVITSIINIIIKIKSNKKNTDK